MGHRKQSYAPEQLTKEQLLEKQAQGTLTQEETLQFLMIVRGYRRKVAEAMMRPQKSIITDTLIHLEQ